MESVECEQQSNELETKMSECSVIESADSELVIVDKVQVENIVTVAESCEDSEVTLSFVTPQEPSENDCFTDGSGSPAVTGDTVNESSCASVESASNCPDSPFYSEDLSVSEVQISSEETYAVIPDGIACGRDDESYQSEMGCYKYEKETDMLVDDNTFHNLGPVDTTEPGFKDESKSSDDTDGVCVRRSSRIRAKKKTTSHVKSTSENDTDGGTKEGLSDSVDANHMPVQNSAANSKKNPSKNCLPKKCSSKAVVKTRRKLKSVCHDNSRRKKASESSKDTNSSECDDSVMMNGKENTSNPNSCDGTEENKGGEAPTFWTGVRYLEKCQANVNYLEKCQNDLKTNRIFPAELSVRLSNISVELESGKLKQPQQQQAGCKDEKEEEHSTIKPEKVKSRWRRSSELEHGELTASPIVAVPETYKPPVAVTLNPEVVLNPEVGQPAVEVTPTPAPTETDGEELKIPEYEEIEKNVLTFERKRSRTRNEFRRMVCDCTLTKEDRERGAVGCDGDCLNRLLMIECGSRCATGDACSNKRFQKKQYVKVEPFKTVKKGWGLRALEDVAPGTFVIEYLGEVLNRQSFKQRVKQYAKDKCRHYYFMALKNHEIIDATYKGNLSRFINHSCDPNCETQKWTVNGELRIGFFATKTIKAGEEVTFDYALQRYGREAQKCYCESENCTGFIGDANDEQQSVEGSVSGKIKRKRSSASKKKDFGDLVFDEEIEKLCGSGGLRNREQTLLLARLMVRAEDAASRLQLLDVILETTEIACLRLFLDYHGLPLLWSWMVDVSTTDSKIKSKILKVLSALPVPNKTMLLDSKVLSVVEKWSQEESANSTPNNSGNAESNRCTEGVDNEDHSLTQDDGPFSKKQKLSDTSDSETDGPSSSSVIQTSSSSSYHLEFSDSLVSEKNENPLSDAKLENSGSSSESPNSVTKSDEDSADATDNGDESCNEGLRTVASELLKSWSALKEVFRIPRLEKQKREQDEQEADRGGQAASDFAASDSECSYMKVTDYSQREMRNESGKREGSYVLEKPSLEIPVIRSEFKKFKTTTTCVPVERPCTRRALLPTPKKLTKEERRHLFAMEVQQRDEEALRKQSQENKQPSVEMNPTPVYTQYPYNPGPYSNSSDTKSAYPQMPPSVPVHGPNTSIPPPIRPGVPPPGFPENIPLNVPPPQYPDMSCSVSYPPGMVYQQPPTPLQQQLPFLGAPPPSLSHPPPPAVHSGPGKIVPPPTVIPPPVHGVGALHHAPVPTNTVPAVGNLPQAIPLPVVTSSCLPGHTTTPSVAHNSALQHPAGFGGANISTAPPVCPPSYLQAPQSYANNTTHPVYYNPCSSNVAPEQVTATEPPHVSNKMGGTAPPVSNKPVKLPPHWKTAKDPEGNIYYYHSITRQTQWDPPEYDSAAEDDDGTPTMDEPKGRRRPTTAAADTSFVIEVSKKIKELFRTKMSTFVVHCLNAYRKPDCTVGRITSTEDFKHLARKLTHFVMAKELKHCKNIEELECNENVKHKAKDYIQKYMSKFGAVYRKEKTASVE